MSDTYTIRQGATLPTLTVTPTRDDGSVVDVTGASVRFLIRDVNLANPLISADMNVTSSRPAVLVYAPAAGDTDFAGDFLGEVEVAYADGTIESFPTTGFIPITIVPSLAFSGVPQPGGKSGADWIADVRNHLAGPTREQMNTLAQDISPNDTSFTLGHDTGLSLGDRLCVGLETMHVWSYSSSSRTVTVQRGVDGTQPLSASQDTLALVNPRFTDARIWSALKECLPALQSAGLFQVKTLDRVFVNPIRGLDLADDLIGDRVLECVYLPADGLKVWRDINQWQVVLNADTDDYPSGKMIYFAQDYIVPALWPVKITYAAALGLLRSPVDEVSTQTGLPDSALDLPPLYAAVKLLGGAPVARANPTGQPTGRRPDEVSTSDVLNSGSALRALYQQRVAAEVTRLQQRFPYRQARRRVTR